ncbi:MAG TPA: type IV pilus secretin PilQ [Candidatus Acidoferrales bacterium]|nr:type IV pilus secretin PilQ [Candidatus Acidoferrales bacterium]
MSKIWRPLGLACLTAASLLIPTGALRADSGASVKVTSAVGQGVVRLEAKASGPFDYEVHHPSTNLYYIDLTGVTAAATDAAQILRTDIVRSYRLEQYESGPKTISRLEILVGDGATPKVSRLGRDELEIVVSKKGVFSAHTGASNQPRIIDAAMHVSAPVGSSGAFAAIRQISIAKDGDVPEVLVLGTGSFNYHELRLSKPARLVLDFNSAHMSAAKKISSNVAPIREVRAGQFSPQVARVVIDLSAVSPYQVKHVDGGIAVEFAAAPASDSAPSADTQQSSPALADAAATGSSSAQPAQPSDETQTQTQTQSTAQSSPKTTASVSASPSQDAAKPAGFAAPLAQAQQQSTTPKPATTPQIAPPAAATPALVPAEQSAVPDSSSEQAVPAQASTAGVSAPVNPASVISQDSQVPGGTKYTGAPISVNLKNVDLQDFFRLIHEISGLNVVVDPGVKGTLTLVLDNVPWDQALDIVLQNNDLDKQLDGNVLRIATKATVKREADEAKDLAKSQVEAADLVTTTRVLSYAKASEISDTVKKFLSPRGDVLADPRTNTLIISDIPTVIPVVDNLIRELDKRSQQVEIEARVVAANRTFARELGSQFAFSGSATGGRNLFGGVGAVGTSPITRFVPPLPVPPVISGTTPPAGGTASTGVSMPLVTNLATAVPTSGVSYAFSSANFALDYIISAAESKGVGKLLSKPTEITQNNEQVTIKQGTKIPIQTVINNTISVQFTDAVLELQVTPQITKEGTIFMTIHVENTQIDPAIPRIQGIPALDTQSEDTKVLVDDGQTIRIGGILVSNQQTTVNEVPFVGSIPIVGQLFRHTTISTNSQELLIFITPRILPM